MALKGAYNYAGINLTEAYVRIDSVHWKSNGDMEMVETKPAVFDRPGGARIVQPAAVSYTHLTLPTKRIV